MGADRAVSPPMINLNGWSHGVYGVVVKYKVGEIDLGANQVVWICGSFLISANEIRISLFGR